MQSSNFDLEMAKTTYEAALKYWHSVAVVGNNEGVVHKAYVNLMEAHVRYSEKLLAEIQNAKR